MEMVKKPLNNRLVELYQEKAKLKKKRDRSFHWFWWYCIFPWILLGISTVIQILIRLAFDMPWEKEVSKFLTIGNFFLIIAFSWGVWYMFRVKKYSRELDKIDEELEKESRSSFF